MPENAPLRNIEKAWEAMAMSPKAYEKMRDSFKKEGMCDKAAKQKAAKIYNSRHPKAPVTRKKEK